MNILTIDSSNEFLVLGAQSATNTEKSMIKAGNRHSEFILPEIDNILKKVQLDSVSELDMIAYNYGPGAFTGLRIGLGCALGLAYSNNTPLAAIPSFLLYTCPESQKYRFLAVALDARLNQVYFAVINQEDFSYRINPCLIPPEEIIQILESDTVLNSDNCWITGNGIPAYLDKTTTLSNKFAYLHQEYPDASRMLELCNHGRYQRFDCKNADLMYIRDKVALNLDEQKKSKAQ
ncbi:tRNA (adenosine(37)-N6)-threonylcarbamoyltransferase complex dimerization subunit type 1 TsaB [Aquella oligotrophica]|uniref:tRNA (Adenosine(37)-N6)-threonylcarbamoyltransferase complex dimerization subunit type 1 TsaB n=1 Tax=Aquella oligotrophica TaxID=2067065 RepID=A0A2I7N3V9_9NEIS|nr:tRNA (adenosine(37)-N6)-threonylcarbamoyltransferase complex dimerization subunit type 1 TsaB [Aquella oligotrophica]AUR51133.1 tRNA (adenosine(37)-N6)-threonylcarbamoyltransferase complex dimerization subunit type 1 TsaB [Aquella oligotrophica]